MKTDKQYYVECKGIPDQEKDQKGNLLRFTIPYHLITESQIRTVGYYDFELKQWWAEDHPESTVKSYLKPITIPSEGITENVKIHLTLFLGFLLKEGYCDSDVYAEPPTAIDQYINLFRKEG